jgi:hypothetical protein
MVIAEFDVTGRFFFRRVARLLGLLGQPLDLPLLFRDRLFQILDGEFPFVDALADLAQFLVTNFAHFVFEKKAERKVFLFFLMVADRKFFFLGSTINFFFVPKNLWRVRHQKFFHRQAFLSEETKKQKKVFFFWDGSNAMVTRTPPPNKKHWLFFVVKDGSMFKFKIRKRVENRCFEPL